MAETEINQVREAAKLLSKVSNDVLRQIQLITSEEIKIPSMEEKITQVLKGLGIPVHIRGYQYIKFGISKMIQDVNLNFGITTYLYPEIAKEFKTTPTRVERAMRHAIEVGCDKGNIQLWYEIFGHTIQPSKGKPTNKEFFCGMMVYLKMKS